MDTARLNPPALKRLTAIATASLLAVGLLSFSAAAVLAGPDSGVSVIVHVGDTETVAPGDPPTACTFHLHFEADDGESAISGYFDIHEGDRNGSVIDSGLFDTSSGDGRAPASGVFELENGTYTVTWDNELVRDKSFDWQEIEIFCEEETPPPEITPVPSGSEAPVESETPAPSGSDLPAESEAPPPPAGTEAPAGGVAGVTVTPPATDVGESATGSTSNVVLPVAVLLGIAAIFMTSSLRLRRAVEKRPSGRR